MSYVSACSEYFSRVYDLSMINFLSYRHSLNFEQAKTIADVSLSKGQ